MLQKNLSYINNEVLKNKLEKISINESKRNITYCITPSNDYILLQNDLPLDDVNNPKEAIKQHLKKNIKYEMKSNDIIINFGIGLGYLLDETYNTYPSKIYISVQKARLNRPEHLRYGNNRPFGGDLKGKQAKAQCGFFCLLK